MRLERVVAKDARRATEQVLATFGPDALIVSNQRVNGMTEIVVAIDTDSPAEAPKSQEPIQTARVFAPRGDREFGRSLLESFKSSTAGERPQQPRAMATPEPSEAPALAQRRSAEPPPATEEDQDVPPFLRHLAAPPRAQATKAPATRRTDEEETTASEPEVVVPSQDDARDRKAALAVAPTPPSDPAESAMDSMRARELVDMVRAELASMRQEIALSRQVESFPPGGTLSGALQPLAGALTAAGAPIGLRTLLLDQVRDCEDLHEAVDQMKRQLGTTLTTTSHPDKFEGVHVIAGPSGSGKTQMLCRIAARHVAAHGASSIAIISFSDNRIGAWTQLQMLASRLGVDCFRVNGPELLGPMLSELDSRRLVLVDTAGTGFAEKLDAIRRCAPKALFNLVMPADASISGISRFIPAAPVPWHSVMVSKLDESACAWPLIQALCNHPIPLSVGSADPSAEAPANPLSAADLIAHAFDQLELPAKPAPRARASRGASAKRTTSREVRHAA